ncbi:MAG TPA: branched-chain amino acid ABC transporter permease [Anaerolineales bacterium]|nr:branched-chain amino acid ABC transporter permease [Anaerolineales bacterium]
MSERQLTGKPKEQGAALRDGTLSTKNSNENKKIPINLILGGIIVLLLILLPFYAGQYTITTFKRIIYFGFLALSLRFLIGEGGMVSLTQTAFFGVTGYVVGLLGAERGMPFPWAQLIAIGAVLFLALIFGMVAVRTYKIVFLMITLAFGQICWAFARQNTSLLHGWSGIHNIEPFSILGIDFTVPANYYWICLALFLIGIYVMWRLVKSPFGLALNGVRESPRRMAALGYPVYWIRLVAFLIAAIYAGIGGILMTYANTMIAPDIIQMSITIWILLTVILGGVNYFWGPIVGVTVVVWLDVFISSMTDRYNSVIGIIFLLIVLFSPNGILGFFDLVRRGERFGFLKKILKQVG